MASRQHSRIGDHTMPGTTQNPPPICTISATEFSQFRKWVYQVAGIHLADHKQALVMGRLAVRLRHYKLANFGEYFRVLCSDATQAEAQTAIDLLTTNETYFFREPKHFDFMKSTILPAHPPGRPFRAWSAAASSGEEPYSIAMTLADSLGERQWEVLATDLSSRVLDHARRGHYTMKRADSIPRGYLHAHCLKGVDAQAGTFLIAPHLRNRVRFAQVNLNHTLPKVGDFDLVFLRNIMIYFDLPTKIQVIARILPHLRPGGHLFIGHSESLNGVTDALKSAAVSIYRKD